MSSVERQRSNVRGLTLEGRREVSEVRREMKGFLRLKRSRALPMVWTRSLPICLTFIGAVAAIAETPWQLAKEEDGIRIETRAVASSPIKQFRASTKIEASLASVLAVMLDSGACPEWVYRCENAKVLKRNGFGDSFVYRTINLPWPAADRDIVMHKVVANDPESKVITIKNASAPDYVARTRLVRIEVSESVYRLVPNEDGTVQLTWTQLSDPAGSLPNALVNAMIVTSPLSTLKSLRKMVRKDKYRNAELRYDAQGKLTGFADKRR